MGADLQNEPHSASWGKGLGDASDWGHAAERIGNHVLGKCARWLILVEGVAYTPGAPGMDSSSMGIWCVNDTWWLHGAHRFAPLSVAWNASHAFQSIASPVLTIEQWPCRAVDLSRKFTVLAPIVTGGAKTWPVRRHSRSCSVILQNWSTHRIHMGPLSSCSHTSKTARSRRTWRRFGKRGSPICAPAAIRSS